MNNEDSLRKYYSGTQSYLLGKREAAEALYKRFGEKGLQNESTVRAWIEELLPSRFGVASGFVVGRNYKLPPNGKYEYSKQCDTIIYHRDLHGPLMRFSSATVLPGEAVVAVVEIKTTLSLSKMDNIAKAASALKNAVTICKPHIVQSSMPFGSGGLSKAISEDKRPLFAIFAFDIDGNAKDLKTIMGKKLEKDTEKNKKEMYPGPDMICLPGKGLLMAKPAFWGMQFPVQREEDGYSIYYSEASEEHDDTLLAFAMILLTLINNMYQWTSNLFRYTWDEWQIGLNK